MIRLVIRVIIMIMVKQTKVHQSLVPFRIGPAMEDVQLIIWNILKKSEMSKDNDYINCIFLCITEFLRLNPVFLIEYVLKGLNTATAAGRQVNSNLEHQSWIESSNGHCWPAEPSTSDSIRPGHWAVLSLGNTALVATLLHTSTNPNPTPTVGNSQICILGNFWPPPPI